MNQNLSTRYDRVSVQPLPFEEAVWHLPFQYINVLIKPSVNRFREEMGKAGWWIVLVQLLSLVLITVTLGFLGHLIPSAALHAITALSIGPVKPLALLPSPYNGITFVLANFFIGLFTAYLFSKGSGGQGTFLAHLYCLLLCSVPLVTMSGALLLIPATGWLVLLLGSIVGALFIYRMVLHTFIIMTVHRLSEGRATLIVLIIPMMILALVLLVGLLYFLIEGEVDVSDFTVLDVFSGGGKKRRKPE